MVADDPIKHVVVLMLENRSFDQILGGLKAVYPPLEGVDPNNPRSNPDLAASPPIFQAETQVRQAAQDPPHELEGVLSQINGPAGPMSGFVTDYARSFPQTTTAQRAEVMDYYPLGFFPALHTLAENFVVCDHWHASVPASTWCNRLSVHSGTSLGRVKMPSGQLDGTIFNIHLYDQETVYDRLQQAGRSWKIYYGDVPQSLVLVHQWSHPLNYRHMSEFYSDARNAASFPAYVFIEPTYFGTEENDGHPATDVLRADALVAEIYNALRADDALWKSLLFVVLFDEHGGYYDHVYPPSAVPPDNHTEEYTFTQLGVRVPALLISPWLEPGVVATQFDHTSLLKYLTKKWSLGQLANRTAAAKSFADSWHLLTSPRADTPQTLPVTPTVAAAPRAAGAPAPELHAYQQALMALTRELERESAAREPQKPAAAMEPRGLQPFESPEAAGALARDRVERFLQSRRRQQQK